MDWRTEERVRFLSRFDSSLGDSDCVYSESLCRCLRCNTPLAEAEQNLDNHLVFIDEARAEDVFSSQRLYIEEEIDRWYISLEKASYLANNHILLDELRRHRKIIDKSYQSWTRLQRDYKRGIWAVCPQCQVFTLPHKWTNVKRLFITLWRENDKEEAKLQLQDYLLDLHSDNLPDHLISSSATVFSSTFVRFHRDLIRLDQEIDNRSAWSIRNVVLNSLGIIACVEILAQKPFLLHISIDLSSRQLRRARKRGLMSVGLDSPSSEKVYAAVAQKIYPILERIPTLGRKAVTAKVW